MARQEFGQYIVVDDEICHGQATFTGTRIMVWQVVNMVAEGIAWDQIEADWSGRVPKAAIAEALEFAGRVMAEHTGEYVQKHNPAA